MAVKSAVLIGTGPVAPDSVTTQVQVSALAWKGRPSPGTSGPVTLTSTENPAVLTFTGSPWLVSAGRWAVPVSTESVAPPSESLGRNEGYLRGGVGAARGVVAGAASGDPPPPPVTAVAAAPIKVTAATATRV